MLRAHAHAHSHTLTHVLAPRQWQGADGKGLAAVPHQGNDKAATGAQDHLLLGASLLRHGHGAGGCGFHYLQLPVSFGREFCSRSALAWLQLGGSGATLTAWLSIALTCCAAACSNARLGLRRFPLETCKPIYQWRLETSESGEVKLALNEPIKSGREKQDSKQGRHLLACMPPALPVLPAALAKLRTH